MRGRLEKLFSFLSAAQTFADVGCDHGYCAEYMLKNGLCERAIVTDVSAACLKKAEVLLKEYVKNGRCVSLCTDGLRGVPKTVNLVLIAGMGGMEIVHILSAEGGFIPERFVLQPMRDSAKVRSFLLESGACIERDVTFESGGKYYDVIVGKRTGQTPKYSEEELFFGRENLRERGEDFLNFLREQIEKTERVIACTSGRAQESAREKLRLLKEVAKR